MSDSYFAAFWPFVSPDDAEISGGQWDDMEGVIAITSKDKLLIARVSDDNGYEELWHYEMPNVCSFLSTCSLLTVVSTLR